MVPSDKLHFIVKTHFLTSIKRAEHPVFSRHIFAARKNLIFYQMTHQTIQSAEFWMSEAFDAETREKVSTMMSEDPTLLEDSFYKNLEFGTGGLRGEMGVGPNRMNRYTVSMATQGLADYLKESFSEGIRVAIAHDSRNMSPEFARTAAEILSANGIEVHLFGSLRPTPLLSYSVRELNCNAGIVITASHNPKEYNGYKVYWEDGGQLVPPHDKGVINKVRAIDSPSKVNSKAEELLIHSISSDVEESYYQKMQSLLRLSTDSQAKKDLKIVFTSLHGTGITMIPKALERAGFSDVLVLASQKEPNGDFPTVASPNPEERSAMTLALEEAKSTDADIVIGTDPDADRVGMGIRNKAGDMELINGNQAAALLVHFLLETLSDEKKKKGFVAKTVVTSELLRDITMAHDVPCYETLTGFKYIAELIRLKEGDRKFICGGEESYGYLIGDFVRDKDAVLSSVMLCEMAAWALESGKKVHEMLNEIYEEHGVYREALVSLVKKGKAGAEEIQAIMEGYRKNSPLDIAGIEVTRIADYYSGIMKEVSSGSEEHIELPSSNVLQFFLNDGSKITARPSGTEPKIKYYISVKSEVTGSVDETWKDAGNKINQIKNALGI